MPEITTTISSILFILLLPMDQPLREFHLANRTIVATKARLLDRHRPVYHLHLKRSPIFRLIEKAFPALNDRWPELFLPAEIIIKKMKDGWENEFRTEIATYNLLKPLQGSIIPKFYGEATYEGSPALVISVVKGETLSEVARSMSVPSHDDLHKLRSSIETALRALWRYHVEYQDGKLDNLFLLRNGRVMIIDLELVNRTRKPWMHTENFDAVEYLTEDFVCRKRKYLKALGCIC
ncbi:uncharacterized protein BDV14DRAFT_140063 [Aspergillus stella-maris]|uniref:uncharacterized protein n=1 Tax=Aspergillus stella-maris TaxID=1810926 RepID=UPI003CCDCFAD